MKKYPHSILIFLPIFFFMFFAITRCLHNHKDYNNDYKIAGLDNYSCKNRNMNLSGNEKSVFYEIGHLEGFFEVASANLQKNCQAKIHFDIKLNSGKAKLVLIKPNGSVQILKEIISSGNKGYSEDLLVSCTPGINKIKIVGENFSGSFEISQPENKIFDYTKKSVF